MSCDESYALEGTSWTIAPAHDLPSNVLGESCLQLLWLEWCGKGCVSYLGRHAPFVLSIRTMRWLLQGFAAIAISTRHLKHFKVALCRWGSSICQGPFKTEFFSRFLKKIIFHWTFCKGHYLFSSHLCYFFIKNSREWTCLMFLLSPIFPTTTATLRGGLSGERVGDWPRVI